MGTPWGRRTGTTAALLVAFLALGLRLPLFFITQGQERFLTPDSSDYIRLAENLSGRGVFSVSKAATWSPETFRTPGYPFFLAACSGRDGHVRLALAILFQLMLAALAAALTALLSHFLFQDWEGALIAGGFVALDIVFLEHNFLILTETLFSFLVLCGFWFLSQNLRKGSITTLLGSALSLSLSALTRPIAIYLFAPLSLLLFCAPTEKRKHWNRLAAPALFAAVFLLPPLLWTARNHHAGGRWMFSSTQGLNLLLYRAAAVEALRNGQPLKVQQDQLLEQARHAAAGGGDLDDQAEMLALEILRSHPLSYLHIMGTDVLRLFGGHGLDLAATLWLKNENSQADVPAKSETQTVASISGSGTRSLLSRHPWLAALLALYLTFLGLLYLGSLTGLVRLWQGRLVMEAALLLTPILYFTALSLGGLAYYRFRIPFLPYLAILAGTGFSRLREKRWAAIKP